MFSEKIIFSYEKRVIIDQMGPYQSVFGSSWNRAASGGSQVNITISTISASTRPHQSRAFSCQKLPRRKAGSRKHTPMHST